MAVNRNFASYQVSGICLPSTFQLQLQVIWTLSVCLIWVGAAGNVELASEVTDAMLRGREEDAVEATKVLPAMEHPDTTLSLLSDLEDGTVELLSWEIPDMMDAGWLKGSLELFTVGYMLDTVVKLMGATSEHCW